MRPELGSAPPGTALWGPPPSPCPMEVRGKGQQVRTWGSALPCCHVPGLGGLILWGGSRDPPSFRGQVLWKVVSTR